MFELLVKVFFQPESKVSEPYVPDIPIPIVEEGITWQLALLDHDYCIDPESAQPADAIIEVKVGNRLCLWHYDMFSTLSCWGLRLHFQPSLESTESIDHDYCFQTEEEKVPVPPKPVPEAESKTNQTKPNSSSSSSSDSDSSCACGSSCSCSDSSSSSSSSDSSNSDSSTEEGRKRQQQRRLKRKERNQLKKNNPQRETELKVDVVTADQPVVVPSVAEIRESDLETTESETDEEFYDREPQKFAKKILAEKRAQLLTEMGSDVIPNGSFFESTSRPPTPPAGTLEEEAGICLNHFYCKLFDRFI